MFRLFVAANIVPSSPILVTLMMEALHSSETSVLTRATPRKIPEDILIWKSVSAYVVWVTLLSCCYHSQRCAGIAAIGFIYCVAGML
jgi:hypothetical protein